MKINILEYLQETLKAHADKPVIFDKEASITLQELNQKAKILASAIKQNRALHCPIAVYLAKSIESIIADIAITYSGNIYMNLDIKNPQERIRNICEQIAPALIITTSKLQSQLPAVKIPVILIDTFDFSLPIAEDKLTHIQAKLIDTDPYCIINTSGSTGTPKGVVLNHRSFIDFIERSFEAFDISENDVIGSLSPLVFDIYSIELCFLMAKACPIVLIPDALSAFPIEILKLIQKYNISFLFWVPTIMVNMANIDLLSKIELPSLKLIWFAGEVFPTSKFNYWHKKLPHVLFANLYGPIEITLDCTYFIVNRELADDEPIPIGYAYKNTDILILNEKDEPVQQGEEGELCVRGTSLAMGYYNNPQKTAEVFVQNPLNSHYLERIYRTGDIVSCNERNEIIFKGRKDNLIKHLGYRIDLDEIEHVIINTLKIIKNGCAAYHASEKKIILFYENDSELSPADFRKQIGIQLPKYMIPTAYIKLDQLPTNANGKIDRLALKKSLS